MSRNIGSARYPSSKFQPGEILTRLVCRNKKKACRSARLKSILRPGLVSKLSLFFSPKIREAIQRAAPPNDRGWPQLRLEFDSFWSARH